MFGSTEWPAGLSHGHGNPAPSFLCFATKGDHVTSSGQWTQVKGALLRQTVWHSSLLFLPTLKRCLIFETAATIFPQGKAKRTLEMSALTLLSTSPHPLSDFLFCETKKPLFVQVPARQVFCCLQLNLCLTDAWHFLLLSFLCAVFPGGRDALRPSRDSRCCRASLLPFFRLLSDLCEPLDPYLSLSTHISPIFQFPSPF